MGTKISGTFKLYQGTQLKILVGQEGLRNEVFSPDARGGGGGGDGNGGPAGIVERPLRFITGGTGGTCPVSHGGSGGGAFAFELGGSGGGYSGGVVVGTSSTGVTGGGGSYNNGKNQLNMARVNKGRGNVFIKFKL